MHFTPAAALCSLISLAAVVRAGKYEASWETCKETAATPTAHGFATWRWAIPTWENGSSTEVSTR